MGITNTDMGTGWQRARQPEQKEARRAGIRNAAARLFAESGYDEVTLGAIAAGTGVSKAALYRYFESKEEIFLDLLRADLADWTDDVETALAPLAGSDDADAVAAALVEAIARHPRLSALLAIVAGVLEHNVDEATALGFKLAVADLAGRAVVALGVALPSLSPADLADAFRAFGALSNGLWPQAHPAPVVAKAQERPELAGLVVDYERDLRRGIALILKGLLAEHG